MRASRRVGLAPTALWAPPHPPFATGGPFPQAIALPSPLALSLARFALPWEGAAQAGVGEGSKSGTS